LVIKICPACRSTWAGGLHCEDCGGALRDPFDRAARELPASMWGYIRLQYGARRGMLVRVMAFLLAPVVFVLGAREAVLRPWPGSALGVAGAALAALGVFCAIYWLAGKAVRVWVLRRGQLNKRRMARALLKRALGSRA
jgi:hypothetical protein